MFRDRYGKRTLNERELRIIELVAMGLKNSEVAATLGTSQRVIKKFLRAIYDKLGVWNRVELALWYESRKHRGELNWGRRRSLPSDRGAE
jgi:DNA-binding NarL/FixJ family response regulator